MYENIYLGLYAFAHFEIWGVSLCQVIGIYIPIRILIISRLTSSIMLKVFSIPIGLLFYFFASVVDLFQEIVR